MVKRFELKPERLILKNSFDNSVFDTDNKYIKQGSSISSSVRLAGYSWAPVIYGTQSAYVKSLGDQSGGGFRSVVLPEITIDDNNANTNPDIYVDLPRNDNIVLWTWNRSDYQGGISIGLNYQSELLNYTIDDELAGTFRWFGAMVHTGTYVSVVNYGIVYVYEPLIHPAIISRNSSAWRSGTFYFPKSTIPVGSWTKRIASSSPTTFREVYTGGGTRGVGYRTTVHFPQSVVLTSLSPTLLSMAVTP